MIDLSVFASSISPEISNTKSPPQIGIVTFEFIHIFVSNNLLVLL